MTNFNIDEAKEYMLQWISDFVSKPNPLLNNFPPCPFAKQAMLEKKIDFEVADKDINLYLCEKSGRWTDDVDVCCIFVPGVDPDTLSNLVMDVNKNYLMPMNLLALEDHPQAEENVNGVIMNNGKYPIVLMQRLSKIQNFSNILKKQGYYDVWSEENLDDVVNWRTTHHEDPVKS
jgi:hypothetical protein